MTTQGQFLFEGEVAPGDWNGQAYLSEITDYRKLDGVYNEQLLMRVPLDSLGRFSFSGSNLSETNALYRIHVDQCTTDEQEVNHFTGHCDKSKAMILVANNRDTISLPLGFDREIFCEAISTNPATSAIIQVDSLMDVMKYEFVGIRSKTAERKLLNDWFAKLQRFGAASDPLVELYIHSKLTDRSTLFYDYYKTMGLADSDYYFDLSIRLREQYKDSPLRKQYSEEYGADRYSIEYYNSDKADNAKFLILGIILALAMLAALLFWKRKPRFAPRVDLTAQESKILELIKENKTNKEIAAELFISHSTVKTHVNNLYRKLAVNSRDEIKRLNIK